MRLQPKDQKRLEDQKEAEDFCKWFPWAQISPFLQLLK
jgi:hypothetical protein